MMKSLKFLFFTVSMVLIAEHAFAQSSSYGELQCAYLYNFAKYTKCPGDKPLFVINVLGETEIMDDLQKILTGKKISGKQIELKQIETTDQVGQCEIVYLSSSASKELASLLKEVAGKHVLVIAEDDLAKKGAGISFFVEDDKLKFKINQKMLKEFGIQPSEGLLKLAVRL